MSWSASLTWLTFMGFAPLPAARCAAAPERAASARETAEAAAPDAAAAPRRSAARPTIILPAAPDVDRPRAPPPAPAPLSAASPARHPGDRSLVPPVGPLFVVLSTPR